MNYLVLIAAVVCVAAVVCSAEEQSPFAESSALLQESFGQVISPDSDAAELGKSVEPSADSGKIRQKRQFFGGYGGYGGFGRRRFGGYGGYGGYGGGFRRGFGGYGGYGGYGYGR